DFQSSYLDRAGDGPAMVQDGRAAALWGGGTGWPGFTTVARGPQGAGFIAPSAEERARIQAKHPFLKTMSIPAGSYPGQSEPIVSGVGWASARVAPALREDPVHRPPRPLPRGQPILPPPPPQGHEPPAANPATAAPRADLIHPGARRYFREIGLIP